MIISDITEGVTQIWGRTKGKMVRKYRCTTGSRKGRIVASPSTCNAPKRVKSSISMKKAKRRGSAIATKTTRTKKYYGTSPRVAKLNKMRPKSRRTSRRRKIK
jgi:hypothetical protein